jgi:hypothetical protein
VNASVNTMGFAQNEENDQFEIKLYYSVDLVTPSGDTLNHIFDDSLYAAETEEFMDLILEAQLEIDSALGEGIYKLIFNVQDEYSQQSKSVGVDFNLSK